ncbi:fibronectin type III domain-containing protein [Curtobacterium sp. ISL-83]|uniref:fibronectin type III domain-containing protein n=1 Tax=Curtobacterium sp. ISL-83 TaxID=2819145 RepID=UPI001BEA59F9|nr:fibronectin type III domain-containing protein [Curtobacterium sp. ISL-83]MBT2501267.1 fibronectin type III domain-containing protein [Curtobacterium sp. ISL-83]
MFRAVLTAAAAVALVIGGVAPASAATAASVPGAPTAVAVAASADGATVTWNAPRTGAKVTGWRVAVTPAERQPDHGVDRLPASARSDRFGALGATTTYRFTVRAVGARGTGPAVTVQYHAPAPVQTVESLYGLDAADNVVRFPTSGSEAPTTVAPDGQGFTADDVGDVFVPSADGTSILEYPADGSAPRTLAAGLHLTADLRSDVAGNLYWVDAVSHAITKLPVTGAAPVRVLPSAGAQWVVGRDGTVSTAKQGSTSTTVVQVSPLGKTTTRAIPETGYRSLAAVLPDGAGNLYFDYFSTGASGYSGWMALPAGATDVVSAEPRTAFEYGATNGDGLLIGQSAGWCAAPADARPGGCTADKTVTHLVSRLADGTTTEQTTSGVTSEGRGVHLGAADEAGDLFFTVGSGPTPGLWRLSATGGAARQLATTQYQRLLVI